MLKTKEQDIYLAGKSVFAVLFLLCAWAAFLLFLLNFSPILAADTTVYGELEAQADEKGVHLNWSYSQEHKFDKLIVLESESASPTYPETNNYREIYTTSTQSYIWPVQDGQNHYFRVCAYNSTSDSCQYTNTSQVKAYEPPRIWFASLGSGDQVSGSESIKVFTNFEADTVKFTITGSSSQAKTFKDSYDGDHAYAFSWETDNGEYPDGEYQVKALSRQGSDKEAENSISLSVDNQAAATNESPYIKITSQLDTVDKPVVRLTAQTNLTPDELNFHITGPKEAVYPGVAAGAGSYYADWQPEQAGFPYGTYQITARAKQEQEVYSDTISLKYSLDRLNRESSSDQEEGSESKNTSEKKSDPDTNTDFQVSAATDLPEPVTGTVKLGVTSDQKMDRAVLRVRQASGPHTASYALTARDPYAYFYYWQTKGLENGEYELKLIAHKNSQTRVITRHVTVKNQSQKQDQDTEHKTAPSSGQSEAVDKACLDHEIHDPAACREFLSLPQECREQNIITQKACNRLMEKLARCRQQDIGSLEPCLKYLSLDERCRQAGIKTRQACQRHLELDPYCREHELEPAKCHQVMALPPDCRRSGILEPAKCQEHIYLKHAPELCRKVNAKSRQECRDALAERRSLSPECLENGVRTLEECRTRTKQQSLPQVCQDRSLASREQCAAWVRNRLFRAPLGQELEQLCQKQGVSRQGNCRHYLYKSYAPAECQEAGAKTMPACKRLLFERYSRDQALADRPLPALCRIHSLASPTKCRQALQQVYLPDKCRDKGFSEPAGCSRYLNHKYLPRECLQAGITDMGTCEEHLFDKYAPDACEQAGLTDSRECRSWMFNRYGVNVTCKDLDRWECLEMVETRYLGLIAARQSQFEALEKSTRNTATSGIKVKHLAETAGRAAELLPLGNSEARVRTVRSEQEIKLNQDSELVQTPPVVVVVDSDNDGLSDAMEHRLGTNPRNPDTDTDGYQDGAELQNGYNPNGPGKLKKEQEPAPAEEAILKNRQLDHPKTSGRPDDLFVVDRVKDRQEQAGAARNTDNSGSGYVVSGKAVPGAVVTLYIYSDLPLVTTIETDKYGNWKYELRESLVDGQHEAYVALNDNTGKVVAKSRAFEFFVKEARAVSASEYIAVADSQNQDRTQSFLKYYLIMAGLVIVVGILLFIIFLNIYKNSRHHHS